MTGAALRDLPAVDHLAAHPLLRPWRESASGVVVQAARTVIDGERAARRAGAPRLGDEDALAAAAAAWLRRRLSPGPRRVINATGVVVHTNLGRAPLSAAAAAAAAAAGSHYSDLEFDLATGARGSRGAGAAAVLATLCGAEDATFVTNNAAAVLLVLRALCRNREVLVSRGEAVEIGGGFRVPDVMRESGARMVDVGTTNRTRADDYAAMMSPRTAAIMRVHPSNFAVVGFTERPTTAECAAVAHSGGALLIEDCGSGAFDDVSRVHPGLSGEPVLGDAVRAGADIVTASGDKLCGGPQVGMIAGRADLVARVRRHPLMRALRPDKMILAAAGATLAAHLRGTARDEVPVLRMIGRDAGDVAATAERWAAALRDAEIPASTAPSVSTVGGGTLPGQTLPTTCLVISGSPERLARALREADPPVVARVAEGRTWLDPRTVDPQEGEALLGAIRSAWAAAKGPSRR